MTLPPHYLDCYEWRVAVDLDVFAMPTSLGSSAFQLAVGGGSWQDAVPLTFTIQTGRYIDGVYTPFLVPQWTLGGVRGTKWAPDLLYHYTGGIIYYPSYRTTATLGGPDVGGLARHEVVYQTWVHGGTPTNPERTERLTWTVNGSVIFSRTMQESEPLPPVPHPYYHYWSRGPAVSIAPAAHLSATVNGRAAYPDPPDVMDGFRDDEPSEPLDVYIRNLVVTCNGTIRCLDPCTDGIVEWVTPGSLSQAAQWSLRDGWRVGIEESASGLRVKPTTRSRTNASWDHGVASLTVQHAGWRRRDGERVIVDGGGIEQRGGGLGGALGYWAQGEPSYSDPEDATLAGPWYDRWQPSWGTSGPPRFGQAPPPHVDEATTYGLGEQLTQWGRYLRWRYPYPWGSRDFTRADGLGPAFDVRYTGYPGHVPADVTAQWGPWDLRGYPTRAGWITGWGEGVGGGFGGVAPGGALYTTDMADLILRAPLYTSGEVWLPGALLDVVERGVSRPGFVVYRHGTARLQGLAERTLPADSPEGRDLLTGTDLWGADGVLAWDPIAEQAVAVVLQDRWAGNDDAGGYTLHLVTQQLGVAEGAEWRGPVDTVADLEDASLTTAYALGDACIAASGALYVAVWRVHAGQVQLAFYRADSPGDTAERMGDWVASPWPSRAKCRLVPDRVSGEVRFIHPYAGGAGGVSLRVWSVPTLDDAEPTFVDHPSIKHDVPAPPYGALYDAETWGRQWLLRDVWQTPSGDVRVRLTWQALYDERPTWPGEALAYYTTPGGAATLPTEPTYGGMPYGPRAMLTDMVDVVADPLPDVASAAWPGLDWRAWAT